MLRASMLTRASVFHLQGVMCQPDSPICAETKFPVDDITLTGTEAVSDVDWMITTRAVGFGRFREQMNRVVFLVEPHGFFLDALLTRNVRVFLFDHRPGNILHSLVRRGGKSQRRSRSIQCKQATRPKQVAFACITFWPGMPKPGTQDKIQYRHCHNGISTPVLTRSYVLFGQAVTKHFLVGSTSAQPPLIPHRRSSVLMSSAHCY